MPITKNKLTTTTEKAFQITSDFNIMLADIRDSLKVLENKGYNLCYRAISGKGVEASEFFAEYAEMTEKLEKVLNILGIPRICDDDI